MSTDPNEMPAMARSAQREPPARTAAGKTLDVLSAFAGPRSVLGVSEVAALADLPKSTAFRLLTTMSEHGFVKREGARYRLGEHMFELGSRALQQRSLRDRAIPHLAELHRATLETVHLAVLAGTELLCIEKVFGFNAAPHPTAVGTRLPVTCTALGKAILSRSDGALIDDILSNRVVRMTPRSLPTPEAINRDLHRARETGIALERGEFCENYACVAAPIINRSTGQAVAAISISASTARFNPSRFAAPIVRAVDALSL